MMLQNSLVQKHFKAFGEIPDIAALMADPKARKIGLKRLYEETFAPQYEAKAKAEQEARDKKLVEETEARVRRELGVRMPYPVGGAVETSVLDEISKPPAEPRPTGEAALDRAVSLYEEEARRATQQTA